MLVPSILLTDIEYVRKYIINVQKYKNTIENIEIHEINGDYR